MQLSKQAAQEPSSDETHADLFVKNGNGQHAAGTKTPPPIVSPANPSLESGRAGLQPKSPLSP